MDLSLDILAYIFSKLKRQWKVRYQINQFSPLDSLEYQYNSLLFLNDSTCFWNSLYSLCVISLVIVMLLLVLLLETRCETRRKKTNLPEQREIGKHLYLHRCLFVYSFLRGMHANNTLMNFLLRTVFISSVNK